MLVILCITATSIVSRSSSIRRQIAAYSFRVYSCFYESVLYGFGIAVFLRFAPEASCHWGTWGTCLPLDSVATLVNSLQNRVKSITLCVTLNANTGKIVLVTLCIEIEWLFYNAFWRETVTRKCRWLHPGHEARAQTFTNDWARGHRE